MTGFVPFNNNKQQYDTLRAPILATIDRVLSSGILMNGREYSRLCDQLCEKTGFLYSVPTHSGSVALQIIASYMKIGIDDPIVSVPAISFPATANAFLLEGWRVKFLDVDDFGNALWHPHNSDLIAPVGLYGLPVDLRKFTNSGVRVVEDACQSWLSLGAKANTIAISFDPTKNVASIGNGGAVLTNDADLARFARRFCNHGKASNAFLSPGSNLRMSEVECAIVSLKMSHSDAWQAKRREIASTYMKAFSQLPVTCLVNESNLLTHGLQKFVIRTEGRDDLNLHMKLQGVECKVHYETPLPLLQHLSEYNNPPTSNYLKFSESVLSLPFYPELTDDQINQVVEAMEGYFDSK